MDRDIMEVNFETYNQNQDNWFHPFNQATFWNYDVNGTVQINQFEIQPAQLVAGVINPTFLELALNTNQVNGSNFNFRFPATSTTKQLVIIYTEFKRP